MEIKTITCHDVYNYGASLQAYALMKYLQEKGHNVEIIDYKPDYLSHRYNFWYINEKSRFNRICSKIKLIHLLYALKNYNKRFKAMKRKKKFDQFKEDYLMITSNRYYSNDDLKVNPPEGKIFITGSDQVWNSVMPNGKDPAFYLDFVSANKIKVSYAASFGTKEIADGYVPFVSSMLKKMDRISVREISGLKVLESIGIKGGVHVLDPVFLLTVGQWKSVIKKNCSERYILVYDFIYGKDIEECVQMVSIATGWKIYSVNNYKKLPYADKNISNAGPIEFLEWLNSAQMVISNSFHASAFSVLLRKEFYVFNIKTLDNNTRMTDFLALLNLSDRHIASKEDVNLKEKINYNEVEKLLQEQIAKSYSYINAILDIK
ncbi:MAG: polysaccharide pyruvyl transferase family protein [Ignavibacteria bacterium]|jgi:hypothetical protein